MIGSIARGVSWLIHVLDSAPKAQSIAVEKPVVRFISKATDRYENVVTLFNQMTGFDATQNELREAIRSGLTKNSRVNWMTWVKKYKGIDSEDPNRAHAVMVWNNSGGCLFVQGNGCGPSIGAQCTCIAVSACALIVSRLWPDDELGPYFEKLNNGENQCRHCVSVGDSATRKGVVPCSVGTMVKP